MKNMDNLIRTYRQYKRIADEAKAELDKLKPQIIAELGGDNTVIGDDYKVMYRVVRSARIDSAMLRREYPEIAEECTKVTEANRLTVN
nr:MAG TPA: Exonuclease [Caudoviricetes sp.]